MPVLYRKRSRRAERLEICISSLLLVMLYPLLYPHASSLSAMRRPDQTGAALPVSPPDVQALARASGYGTAHQQTA